MLGPLLDPTGSLPQPSRSAGQKRAKYQPQLKTLLRGADRESYVDTPGSKSTSQPRNKQRTDKWTDGRTDGRTDRRTDAWTDQQINGRTDGQTDGRMDDGQTDRRMHGWTKSTDRPTNRRTDGQTTEGRTDIISKCLFGCLAQPACLHGDECWGVTWERRC